MAMRYIIQQFKTFQPIGCAGEEMSPLLPSDPILSTANRLFDENQLYVIESDDKPPPNSVYYGFNKNGNYDVQVVRRFDVNSRVEDVKVVNSRGLRYKRMHYMILGKVIIGTLLTKRSARRIYFLLEPVDPSDFDGTRESFSRARINTVRGLARRQEQPTRDSQPDQAQQARGCPVPDCEGVKGDQEHGFCGPHSRKRWPHIQPPCRGQCTEGELREWTTAHAL
ncbi:hypothetical protein FOZ60_001448 [Perkinsus olseni]|uniref:Uncharacterized protein n=1 Tax=Perkinsus olseni TaxID=32597 RepID=A0A7J6PJL8_PEROL|nr:hypothetical protein FOZ60_001448 [Perkinsus olseni]